MHTTRVGWGAEWLTRSIGTVLGLSLAAVAIVAWRVPPGTGVVGADVAAVVEAPGELRVTGDEPFVRATGMVPGGERATGSVDVVNQAGARLSVRARIVPSSDALDRHLRVEVRAGETRLYRGRLGGIRTWTTGSFTISPGESQRLDLSVWLPRGDAAASRGRIADLVVELVTEAGEPA